MPLTQAEADALLRLAKEFVDPSPLEFTQTQPMRYERGLLSMDRREQFILDLERGLRNYVRLKYQTRARKVIVLARLDINGSAHLNPPDSPYKPGERFDCSHLHRYMQGFEDRIAFHLPDVPDLIIRDMSNGISCLEGFMRYCTIQNWPTIQTMI
jgi:hypothetical protein